MLPFKTDWMIYNLVRILHKQECWDVCKELLIVVFCAETHLVYMYVVGLGGFFLLKEKWLLKKTKGIFL